MAFVTRLTIGTGNKVSLDYQSQDVNVTLSYELERQDHNLLQLVEQKAAEVELVHSAVWRKIRELRTERQLTEKSETAEDTSNGSGGETATLSSPAKRDNGSGNGTGRTRTRTRKQATPAHAAEASAASGNGRNGDNESGDGSTATPDNGSSAATTATQAALQQGERATEPQQRAIQALARRGGITHMELELMLVERFQKSLLYDLTKSEASSMLLELQRSERAKAQAARA